MRVRTRVWVDESHAIFRRGLASCLNEGGFAVAGESVHLMPEPDLDRTDILLFEFGQAELARATRLARGTPVRLVGMARALTDDQLVDAVDAGIAGLVSRTDLRADTLLSCLTAVAGGSTTLPSSLLAKLSRVGSERGTPAAALAQREIAVLRLLADGGSTHEIAEQLRYSERTIKNIVHDTLMKMNCRTRAHAVALASRQGVI
jgi:DNA-binding NarL/FixJ family response regulator